MQRGRRRYFFGQSPEADTRRQTPSAWPGGDDRERDRQGRPARKKQRIGNRSWMRQRQRAERGAIQAVCAARDCGTRV